MDNDYVSVTEIAGDEVAQEQIDRLEKKWGQVKWGHEMGSSLPLTLSPQKRHEMGSSLPLTLSPQKRHGYWETNGVAS